MHPSLEGLERLRAKIGRGLGIDHLELLSIFLIGLVETLGNDFGGVLNSCELRAKQVLLPTRERWAGVDLGREVAGHLLLDELGSDEVLRLGVGKLNPVADDVVSDPEDGGIDTGTALLLLLVSRGLLLAGEYALCNPVVRLAAEDLAEQLDLLATRDDGQTLQRLLDEEVSVLAEANTGPLEHLR